MGSEIRAHDVLAKKAIRGRTFQRRKCVLLISWKVLTFSEGGCNNALDFRRCGKELAERSLGKRRL